MSRIDLPIAATEGTASDCADPDRETSHTIDWRQLSHELRTPLNAILGNVELLLDGSAGPLSAPARTCIGEVQVAGRQLLRQIGLLLAWSELSAGGPKLARHPVDLIALIREALMIECSNPAQIEPHDACFPIRGDPFWLQMLVAEIVALHGAPGEPPTVRLERHAGGRALGFFWSGFGVDRAGDLRMALIEGIARMQGAAVAPSSDGLILHWPVDQCDRAKAVAPPEEPPPADPAVPSSVQ
jgi:His Kinase A (phospho-acceptor) domain